MFPQLLTDKNQWIVWKFEQYPGDKKPRKVPYYTNGIKRFGKQGDESDMAQLSSFDGAKNALDYGNYDGLGLALIKGDGLICVDIDSNADQEQVKKIIAGLNSYTEISPSGNGYHIWLTGDTRTFKNNDVGIEVFSGSQFLTMTANPIENTVFEVKPISDKALDRLHVVVKGHGINEKPKTKRDNNNQSDMPESKKIETALAYIPASIGYDDWWKVGAAIYSKLGASGFSMWDYWSSKSSKYNAEGMRAKYDSFANINDISILSLYKLACDNGWQPPKDPNWKPEMRVTTPTPVDVVSTTKVESEPQPKSDLREPFKCLGYGEDKYYFYSRERKQIIIRTAASLNESALLELAPMEYWKLAYMQDSNKLPKSDIVNNLLRRCHGEGLFCPEQYTRGRGAWIDNKRLIYHFGDHLNVDGKKESIEDFDSKFVYECSSALSAPDGKALSDAEGQNILDIASTFRWKQSSSALLLAGYIALAPLCGVLRWRPHIWITGGAGSGKSTILNNYVNPLMGNTALFAQGNSTEAGIRQSLKSDALPVVFDEGESNNNREADRMQNVLALIRQSSSDSAAKTLKGTAGGRSMSFHVRSMFCLASIQAAIHHQADLERITKLELKNKGGDNSGDEWNKLRDRLYSTIERDEELSMRLFQRSINLHETTKENIGIFSNVVANKFNSQRKGDQYGTLLAGCWSLINSTVATVAQATAWIDKYDWTEYQEGTEVEESEKALSYFFGCKLKTENHKEFTIHELLTEFNHVPDEKDKQFTHETEALKALKRHDMIHDRENGMLYISNTSSHVANLFRGTVYEAGWRDQMLRAKGVYKEPKKQKKFGGRNSRYFYMVLGEIE